MAQVINTNIFSINSQRALMNSQASMQTSLQRLSSGLRINSAKDDAAGLAIAERMTAQIRGVNQAMRNANDGISLAQTAEGGMEEITNALQRMRELAVQAASGTVGSDDKVSLNKEYTKLKESIDQIAARTEFNGTSLLNSSATVTVQSGADATQTTDVQLVNVSSVGTGDISSTGGAEAAITSLDTDIDTVTAARADLGAIQSSLESTVRNLANVSENLNAARSRIRDADFASETANLTRTQILQQAGAAMLAQANAMPQNVLSLLR